MKPIYGLLAEFETPTQLVDAARRVTEAGYRRTDAYSPFPVEGLAEALHARSSGLPALIFVGALMGCIGGYLLQYIPSVIDYPLNIGGRPHHSWPAFIPVTFELTILAGALTAVLGMLALNGLPMPYHPVFNVERFALASRDRFFLAIEATDPKFDHEGTSALLHSLGARAVTEVPH